MSPANLAPRGAADPRSLVRGRFIDRLFRPVDAAGLAYFRIAFFAVMLWECRRFFLEDWIGIYWNPNTLFHFKFWPFTFAEPLPGDGVSIVILVLGGLATLAALGFAYRPVAFLFAAGIIYLFLLEQARYLNHFYLICLVSALMIVVPAHRAFSVDALLRPGVRGPTVPAWSLWLLRFQIGIPYVFGGIAKLNHDWLRGEPLRNWLSARTEFPFLGQFFLEEPAVFFMAYSALFLDLLGPVLLLFRRTRVFMYLIMLSFHFMNSRLFDIGVFPWMMIAATLVFFPPDWPRRLGRDLRGGHPVRIPLAFLGLAVGFVVGGFLPDRFELVNALIGGLGVAVAFYHLDEPFRRRSGAMNSSVSPARPARVEAGAGGHRSRPGSHRALLTFLGIWVAIQVLLPLRHFAIPGNVHWTEEGHNFSWHMKLRDKESDGVFVVTDVATGATWKVPPGAYLNPVQSRRMLSRPHMVVEFARFLEELLREEGFEDVEIRARIYASLNGRDMQVFLDPDVDLTAVAYPWGGHAQWILPLETSVRP